MEDTHSRVMDYLGTAHDNWQQFMNQVNTNTGDYYRDLWAGNAKKNRALFQKCGWACEEMQDAHEGKTAVLLGASPAIQNQVETLKWLQHDPDFVFIGISSGLEFLINNGIKPRYMLVADADPAMERFWANIDMEATKDITLISNLCTHPGLLAKWQGPIKFLAIYSSEKKVNRLISKKYRPINNTGTWFPAISSQYNTAAAFSFLVLRTPILIFVGSELSFADKEVTYYAGRKDIKDTWARKPHLNIYGKVAYTNYMLMSLKIGLEDFLGKMSGVGWFFNCTEAGIFGMSIEWERNHGSPNLPWIHQLKLKSGIAQARSIMETGQPLYMGQPESRIFVPQDIKTIQQFGGIYNERLQ
jgi:hypothetical protein